MRSPIPVVGTRPSGASAASARPGRNRHGATRSRASNIGASGSGIRAGDLRLHARRLQPLHPLQQRRALGGERFAGDAGREVRRREAGSQRRADA